MNIEEKDYTIIVEVQAGPDCTKEDIDKAIDEFKAMNRSFVVDEISGQDDISKTERASGRKIKSPCFQVLISADNISLPRNMLPIFDISPIFPEDARTHVRISPIMVKTYKMNDNLKYSSTNKWGNTRSIPRSDVFKYLRNAKRYNNSAAISVSANGKSIDNIEEVKEVTMAEKELGTIEGSSRLIVRGDGEGHLDFLDRLAKNSFFFNSRGLRMQELNICPDSKWWRNILDKGFSVLDLETTGLKVLDETLQIACVQVELEYDENKKHLRAVISDSYNSYFKPTRVNPARFIYDLINTTPEVLKRSSALGSADLSGFKKILESTKTVVAYNSPFDASFLFKQMPKTMVNFLSREDAGIVDLLSSAIRGIPHKTNNQSAKFCQMFNINDPKVAKELNQRLHDAGLDVLISTFILARIAGDSIGAETFSVDFKDGMKYSKLEEAQISDRIKQMFSFIIGEQIGIGDRMDDDISNKVSDSINGVGSSHIDAAKITL